MTHFTLSQQDHDRIGAAVTHAEAHSDAEIVTIIAPRSDAYHDVGLHYAIGSVFVLLAAIATFPATFAGWATTWLGGWDHALTAREMMTALLCATILLFLILRYGLAWMPLRMALTPGSTKTRRVRRAAITLFRTAVEGRTRAQTGVLLYLSLAEHRAELVADAAVSAQVEPEAWGDAMAALIHHVRAGEPGEGMVQAIDRIGRILARHVPRSPDDRNELPDRLIEL